MNLQPTLTGERLTLRPLLPEDFPALFAAASDPLIWEIHPTPDRYKENVFRDYFDTGIASKGALAVLGNSAGEIIGSSRYYALDDNNRTVSVGYTFLTRKYWGGSFNREMKRLMLDHAFQHVESVLFEVGETNFRSRRAMEKIGAQLVGKTVLNQKPYVVYEIRKPADSQVAGGQVKASQDSDRVVDVTQLGEK